jgi:hypothetical protein
MRASQRVVPRHWEVLWDASVDSLSVVSERGGLPVKNLACDIDVPAEGIEYALPGLLSHARQEGVVGTRTLPCIHRARGSCH